MRVFDGQLKTVTENGAWTIIEVVQDRTLRLGRRRGWLINNKSGNRYVWSQSEGGGIRYMKQPKTPTNIPKYVTEEIMKGFVSEA